MHRLVKMIGRT